MITVKAIYNEGNVILLEKPKDIKFSKAIVTLIDDSPDFDTYEAMKLSESSFNEWDNKEDEIYDTFIGIRCFDSINAYKNNHPQ